MEPVSLNLEYRYVYGTWRCSGLWNRSASTWNIDMFMERGTARIIEAVSLNLEYKYVYGTGLGEALDYGTGHQSKP